VGSRIGDVKQVIGDRGKVIGEPEQQIEDVEYEIGDSGKESGYREKQINAHLQVVFVKEA